MRSYSFSNEESESSATLLGQSSILVVGASSKTGVECIRQLSEHPSKPVIHAFCEDLSEIDEEVAKPCTTIFEGSVRHAIDIEEALSENGANWVVLCGDASEDSPLTRRQINLRTVSAKNTAQVLSQPRFQSVRVLVVSRIGAGTTSIRFGLRGKLCQLIRRQFLHDNAGQEKAVRPVWDRTTVVRTTMLTDNATATGRIVELSDNDRIPTLKTERADLASCIVDEICARPIPTGNRVVNVTSAKR
jgi:NAD(P)H-binding